ncbi:hypothetical protein DdX_14754 [Ditylenchus destructor]|uniref:Uncharacterized protein n=1 Tax=Ditylenchus destructor TaxID=166010 RepID=A0AAD4R1M9_9BILA|nr:hypothetical protein DdX_14754 [Ditylenchus destructor]
MEPDSIIPKSLVFRMKNAAVEGQVQNCCENKNERCKEKAQFANRHDTTSDGLWSLIYEWKLKGNQKVGESFKYFESCRTMVGME